HFIDQLRFSIFTEYHIAVIVFFHIFVGYIYPVAPCMILDFKSDILVIFPVTILIFAGIPDMSFAFFKMSGLFYCLSFYFVFFVFTLRLVFNDKSLVIIFYIARRICFTVNSNSHPQ